MSRTRVTGPAPEPAPPPPWRPWPRPRVLWAELPPRPVRAGAAAAPSSGGRACAVAGGTRELAGPGAGAAAAAGESLRGRAALGQRVPPSRRSPSTDRGLNFARGPPWGPLDGEDGLSLPALRPAPPPAIGPVPRGAGRQGGGGAPRPGSFLGHLAVLLFRVATALSSLKTPPWPPSAAGQRLRGGRGAGGAVCRGAGKFGSGFIQNAQPF